MFFANFIIKIGRVIVLADGDTYHLAMIIDGYTTLGTERDCLADADDLLKEMQECGVAKAIIAPEDRELVIENHAGNDRILDIARQSDKRLLPACGINPWYGSQGVCELERALEAGARMLVLAPALQGFIPCDSLADDLILCAGKHQCPVYIHSGPHSQGGPSQVLLLAEKHPDVNFILGHCGSTDHAWDMSTILKNHALENLWFELSHVRPWAAANYVEINDRNRFIWGSGAPRNSQSFELNQFNEVISIDEHANIYGGNIATLIDVEEP